MEVPNDVSVFIDGLFCFCDMISRIRSSHCQGYDDQGNEVQGVKSVKAVFQKCIFDKSSFAVVHIDRHKSAPSRVASREKGKSNECSQKGLISQII